MFPIVVVNSHGDKAEGREAKVINKPIPFFLSRQEKEEEWMEGRTREGKRIGRRARRKKM